MTPMKTTCLLQARIDQAARGGGGEVVLEPGLYVCGTLELKSGVHLTLREGVCLRAAADPDLFPGFY